MLTLSLTTGAAVAETRIALMIGNSKYASVPPLANPERDAQAIGQMLRDAGYVVTTVLNAGSLELKRAIRKFEVDADQAEIAVVYYSGHGLSIGDVNYLVPVDARLASDRDADDEAVPLERLVAAVDGAKKWRVFMFDTARENPFIGKMRRDRKGASRGVVGGLGKVEPGVDTLIAYANKVDSTAEDGDGEHSQFAAAVLKNLAVPGLDIRLGFGRVRDEVMKASFGKQEPFIYGSLGGGNIALVAAPAVAQEAPVNDVKADYDLVARIGTKRAWEVFLGTYKTGFYADLARVQLASLSEQPPAGSAPQGDVKVAAVPPSAVAPGREPSSKEALDWDKVKDSTDQAALQAFIKRYPDSPLAITAKQKLDVLQRAAQEREDKARAEREAARKAAEQQRLDAERQKAEQAAAKKREDEERRARAAEAEQRAKAEEARRKAEEAERKAAEAKQRAEELERAKQAIEEANRRAAEERRAREAEAARKAAELAAAQEEVCRRERTKYQAIDSKAAEAEVMAALKSFAATVTCEQLRSDVMATIDRLSTEQAKREALSAREARAWEKVRDSSDQSALRDFIDRYPQSPFAETARQKLGVLKQAAEAREEKLRAEREAARKAAEEQRLEAERNKAELAAAKKREDDERRAKAAESEQRAKAEEAQRKAAEEKLKADIAAAKEEQCNKERITFEQLHQKGSEGADDLAAFAKSMSCERLRSEVAAAQAQVKAEAAKRAAERPNSPELIRAAQTELVRVGCFTGKPDGVLSDATKSGLAKYFAAQPSSAAKKDDANKSETKSSETEITKELVASLGKETGRLCPLDCKSGETIVNDRCVAEPKSAPATASRHKKDDDEDERPRRKPAHREAEREPARSREREHARAQQQRPAPRASQQAARGGGGSSPVSTTVHGLSF